MIDIALHLPAACLHEAFSNRLGFPPHHFELYYCGKRLEGKAALSSWGIAKDSTIEVKMRGRGGVPDTSPDGGGPGTRIAAAGGDDGYTAGSSGSDSDDRGDDAYDAELDNDPGEGGIAGSSGTNSDNRVTEALDSDQATGGSDGGAGGGGNAEGTAEAKLQACICVRTRHASPPFLVK